MPYGPDQAQRETDTSQEMGGDGVDHVEDLVNGEVVQVTVQVFDDVGRPFATSCGGPPCWYSIAQSQIG